jgi:hypothetical protein
MRPEAKSERVKPRLADKLDELGRVSHWIVMDCGGPTWVSDGFTGRTGAGSFWIDSTRPTPARLVICFFLEFFLGPTRQKEESGYLFSFATCRDGGPWGDAHSRILSRTLEGKR